MSEELSAPELVTFIRADVDNCPEIAKDSNIEVLPSILLLQNGKVVDSFIGQSTDKIRKAIQTLSMANNQ